MFSCLLVKKKNTLFFTYFTLQLLSNLVERIVEVMMFRIKYNGSISEIVTCFTGQTQCKSCTFITYTVVFIILPLHQMIRN